MNTLIVKNLNKSFKNIKVLNEINFSIEKGNIVALVGPNGAGKTTLMKCITGLTTIDNGLIEIDGTSINKNRSKYLSNFSSIIETPSLYEMLSGYDNINFIKEINNISKEKFNEILSFVNLGDRIYSKVKTYSLGMKQKLALGMALLTEPKLLILDEPTNGLDPSASSDLCNLLLEMSRKINISILVSSHILSDLEKICDKIIFIKDGSIFLENKSDSTITFSTILLTFDNINEALICINNYSIVDSISEVDSSNIKVKIKTDKISKLLKLLLEDNLYFTNIDIIKHNIENSYNSIYGGNNK
ncbi:ABC transporter ATP-binding protein [Clostridium sp. Sa3CUN1]|uniref:ABC transporter ATP-binding protein n=1 Tax=Clostridium gallinarum TaxID=2762246 RepID=A0ABR8Q710_9CLOT|nr:ABC transporter ATP-binding protein [Clostridium gallinarum]MBD7916220.1 ABC transporter ATP-binding protein [Clostridium gallinarum]